MPWRFGNFELPPKAIDSLLDLGRLGRSDVFADLGSGTGSVVIRAVQLRGVKKAIGIEYDEASREKARQTAIDVLSRGQLGRVDFWLANIHSEDLHYLEVTVAFNSFEEDEAEVDFYRSRFNPRGLRVLKKDLPLVGYRPAGVSRKGSVWFFRMDFPLERVRSRSEWARLVTGRADSRIDDIYEYYRRVLIRRRIAPKEIRLALNNLERLVLLRF